MVALLNDVHAILMRRDLPYTPRHESHSHSAASRALRTAIVVLVRRRPPERSRLQLKYEIIIYGIYDGGVRGAHMRECPCT